MKTIRVKHKMKPIIVKHQDKKIVVFGGGKVGLRKAKYFKEADLHVISDEFIPGFEELDIKTTETELTTSNIDRYISDSFLVIPATNNQELNQEITRRAQKKNILVNQVDGEEGDIVVPSTIEREYLLAISSYGRSPAFSKYMRKKLENELGHEYGLMVRLQEEMRDYLKENIESQSQRKKYLWQIIKSDEVWSLLRKNFYQKAVKKSREIIGERNG